MNKKYCIFDMDGTLVDSMGYWQNLGREFLQKKNARGDIEGVLAQIGPMTMLQSAELFIREFHFESTPEALIAEMDAMIDGHYLHDIPLKAGALDYIRRLQARGCKMCVASSTPLPMIEACLSRLGVTPYMDFLMSSDEVGCGKDRPDVFYAAAKRLGAEPGDIAVFEDADYALETAKKAGFYTVAVQDVANKAKWAALEALAHETVTDWNSAQ